MDLINRQAAIDALDCINGVEEVLRALPSVQPEYTEQDVREAFNAGYACGMSAARPEWHECFEDDPSSYPDTGRMVLVSCSNFDQPLIGRWDADDEGGNWYLGDTDETFLSNGLFADGWWVLPKKPERD